MSDYIKEDLESLRKFVTEYNLQNIFNDSDVNTDFKIIHKKIFSYLVLLVELEYQNKENATFQEKALFYLKESVSDVIQSMFVWVNGAYKSADLLLRSSIENFNKAIIGNDDELVYVEKNVYKIFEMVSSSELYKKLCGKTPYAEVLHNIYAELCKSTHTATEENMEHITALKMLPRYNRKKSRQYKENLVKLIDCLLSFFMSNYYSIIEKMYRDNKEVIFETLSPNLVKQSIEKECSMQSL